MELRRDLLPKLRAIAALAVVSPLLLSCGSDEPAAPPPLGMLNEYSVVTENNVEEPDAPCVGLRTQQTSGATTVTVACPTLPSEEDEYAATIDLDSQGFVVGFGLAENETIVEDGFTDIFVSDEVDGRRFFAAQLADPGDVEAVTISDGTNTRELKTAGTSE